MDEEYIIEQVVIDIKITNEEGASAGYTLAFK